MDFIENLPVIWIATMMLVAYIAMGYDKLQAKRGGRRISEKMLFLFAVLGGSIGAIAGMYTFHHKTRHWYFRYGLPAILVIQIVLMVAYQYLSSK
ncbi:MAG: DUF1294 domain-containing protein [Oscillospiraceae bacterium]